MDEWGRLCALPGCAVEIQIVGGRPDRRYCTAAHRLAARRARRSAVHAQRAAAARTDPAGTLPWLPEPAGRAPDIRATGPVPRPAVGSEVTGSGPVARAAARRSHDRCDDAARGRRALVVIGVAGILAGGYAVTADPGTPDQALPAQATPDGGSVDTWARRAGGALAAVNTQLDTLSRAEEQWRRLPASRTAVVPPPVAALVQRRTVLERRRATLQSQLDAYRSLRATQRELADSEQHLRAVEAPPADASPQQRGGVEQEAGLAALGEQRDLRIRRRDAQRAEVEGLERDVSAAARAPLPDDGAATAKVSEDVLAMVRADGRGQEATPSEADVLAELHEQARRIAREARRAEAEQKPAPARSHPAGSGRHRARENLHVTRVAIRVGPGRHAAPAVDERPHRSAGRTGDEPRTAAEAHTETAGGSAAYLDDDAIEERNAEPAARSG